MKKRFGLLRKLIWLTALLFPFQEQNAQQVPDTSFTFNIRQPAYPAGKGPSICIDQAHFNFHTREGGFYPFAKLLDQDGYSIRSLSAPVTGITDLMKSKILVIANALDSSNAEEWSLPVPSAFSDKEIDLIRQWVSNGGRLLLIADHMPFAGAAYSLGKAFGFEFLNGFAFTQEHAWPPSVFLREENTLRDSPVTNGEQEYEKIDRITTFTGSAFKAPEKAMPVLCFREKDWSLQPDTAWKFNESTPKQSLSGYFQGALLEYGKGKIAVFGEAAMFTAQIGRRNFPVGINSEAAPQNAQFALNLIHWLDQDPVPAAGASSNKKDASATCTINYTGNEGFLVATKHKKILADVLFGNIKGDWCEQPGDSLVNLMIKGISPFNNIDVMLITHYHPDHFNATMTVDFLKNHRETRLVCPSQADERLGKIPGYSEVAGQIVAIVPKDHPDTTLLLQGIPIRVMRFRHNSWFEKDSASGKQTDIHEGVEHLVYQVEPEGWTLLHAGDCNISEEDPFIRYHLADKEFDAVFLSRSFLRPEGMNIVEKHIRAGNIILMHVEPARREQYRSLIKNFPEFFIFSTVMEEKSL